MTSKRRLRRKSCQGKVRYPDLAAAERHLRFVRADHPERPDRQQAYHCRFCDGYHLGHRSHRLSARENTR